MSATAPSLQHHQPPSSWAAPRVANSNIATFTITSTNYTVTWDGGGTDNLASNPLNWTENIAPVNGDSLVFNGTSNKPAIFDAMSLGTVNSLTIAPSYTGDVILQRPLTVTTYLSQAGGKIVNYYNLTLPASSHYDLIAGQLQGLGTVTLAGTMTWLGGSLTNAGTLNITPTGKPRHVGRSAPLDHQQSRPYHLGQRNLMPMGFGKPHPWASDTYYSRHSQPLR